MSAPPTDDEYDEEAFLDDEQHDVERRSAEETGELNETLRNLVWEEDLPSTPSSQLRRTYVPVSRVPPRRRSTDKTIVPTARAPVPSPGTPASVREDTPLLQRPTSLTFVEPPTRTIDNALPSLGIPADGPSMAPVRRTSYSSIRSVERRGLAKAVPAGKSTFGQTVSTSRLLAASRPMLTLC